MNALHPFTHREANLRISPSAYDIVTAEVVRLRAELDALIHRFAEFANALAPLEVPADAPLLARCMADAARTVGDVGPMAAVAGATAHHAAMAAVRADVAPVIVDNGGDLCVFTRSPIHVGLYAGRHSPVGDQLALRIPGAEEPLCLCSSSSRMGHSTSFGDCDLALVIANDGALADAAATSAANQVRAGQDLQPTLARIAAIPGVHGLLLARDDRIGIKGNAMPELVRNRDPHLRLRVTTAPTVNPS